MGVNALGGNTTANYNTAVGTQAMIANTTGTENVALGAFALDANTTANQNTAVGYQSLTSNTTGVGNTALGLGAAKSVSTGSTNTAIGYQALQDTTPTTTGSNNVGIGTNVRTKSGDETGSIIIGHDIESYAVNSFTFGTAAQGFVTNQFSANANWSRPSDERLKQDIQNDTLGLSFINDLRTVTYRWKGNNEIPENFTGYQSENVKDTSVVMHGMIAQEVKTALDNAGVSTFKGWDADDTSGQQMLSTEMFVYPLIRAVQELSAKVTAAEARITTLEG
jgi:hypothetical protein